MSDTHLSNVLGILRLIKKTTELSSGYQTLDYLKKWAEPEADDETTLRLAVYVQSQVSGAEAIIRQSDFIEENKAGLLQTVGALRAAFSLTGLQTTPASHLPALDAAISLFATVVSIVGQPSDPAKSSDLAALIKEVEALHQTVLESEMDEIVRDTARRHLHVLLTLLRNLEAMGVESAMAAYFELVIRLQSVTATSSDATRAEVSKLWPRIETWGKRLSALQKIFGVGTTLAGYAKPLLALIKSG